MTNDQIAKLAKQAGFSFEEEAHGRGEEPFTIERSSINELKRFAELVRNEAPQPAPVQEPVNIEQIAAERYKVAPAHESMFHRWAVVAGDGSQQLYLGREVDCQNMARNFAGAFLDGAYLAASQSAPAPVQEPCAELIDYILQDDIHNRLTPRVVDIAYSAWHIWWAGKNKDDGGPCDWFNDTKPMVMKQLAKIKKDLAEETPQAPQPSPPADVPMLTEDEFDEILSKHFNCIGAALQATEQLVRQKAGLKCTT